MLVVAEIRLERLNMAMYICTVKKNRNQNYFVFLRANILQYGNENYILAYNKTANDHYV
jgi:hypothetical protein